MLSYDLLKPISLISLIDDQLSDIVTSRLTVDVLNKRSPFEYSTHQIGILDEHSYKYLLSVVGEYDLVRLGYLRESK